MKNGKVLKRERRTNFIRLFTKTPPGIVCPHFFILATSNGCPFDCHFCYLLNTLRYTETNEIYSNVGDLEEEVRSHLELGDPTVMNTGELTDSLAWEHNREGTRRLIEIFRGQDRHALLLVTKSDKVDEFVEIEPTPAVIFSFSVNEPETAKRHEIGAPDPGRRLAAAALLQAKGWRVRLRLDPMLRLADESWDQMVEKYKGFIGAIATVVKPERITLGTLRSFPKLPNYAPEESRKLFSFAWDQGDPDRRRRYPLDERVKLYAAVIQEINAKLRTEVGLCKETKTAWISTWKMLGKPSSFDYREPKCNCSR